MNEPNNAQAIISSVKELTANEIYQVDEEGHEFAIIPNGKQALSLKRFIDEYRSAPERATGIATLLSVSSFIEHVKRTSDPSSVVFVISDRAKPSLLAVYNYNDPASKEGGGPRFGDHRAHYAFPLSDEWIAWIGWQGKPMDQGKFAAFIEDRIVDVEEPERVNPDVAALLAKIQCELCGAARLAELSRGLEVRVGQEFSQATRLQTGESALVWKEKHTDEKGEVLKIPGAFLISIPLWRSGDLWIIPVRLRYRAVGSSVVWYYELFRTERIFDIAIKRVCDEVAEATGLPVLEGQPECDPVDDDEDDD